MIQSNYRQYVNPKYCRKCGVRLVLRETGLYSERDGTKELKAACPSGRCYHTGVDHKWIPSGIIRRIFYAFRCENCGMKDYD